MENYLKLLQKYKSASAFNPWNESDNTFDTGTNAIEIRRYNLKNYLQQRRNAKYILIAEALSYQGGHFTGIAMTSERQLLNDANNKIFVGEKRRTSNPEKIEKKTVAQKGFAENTGTIVWNTLSNIMPTYNWINWNCFPFHPYKENNFLSNRAPSEKEIDEACFYLNEFLNTIGQDKKIIAIGNYSELVLNKLNQNFIKVRHPANGGATKFKNQIENFIKNTESRIV